MYRERDPQCSSVDDMVSRPTSADTIPRSASVKRLPVAGGPSSLAALLAFAAGCEWPLATPFAAERGLSGASASPAPRLCSWAYPRLAAMLEHASVWTLLIACHLGKTASPKVGTERMSHRCAWMLVAVDPECPVVAAIPCERPQPWAPECHSPVQHSASWPALCRHPPPPPSLDLAAAAT